MTKPIRITARRVFTVVLSLSLVTAGLCLIGGCLSIYFGEGSYSRELVAAVFGTVAVPVWIAVSLTAVSILWELCAPSEGEHHKAPKAYATVLARLYRTRDVSGQTAALDTQKRRRKTLAVVRSVLVLAGVSVFFGYAVQPANYTDNINTSVIRAMWIAVPCFAVPTLFSVIAARLTANSYEAEIALLKGCPASGIVKEDVPSAAKPRTALTVTRILLLVLALAALIYGFTAGGTADVLTKAINICTECIGLG